MNISNSNDGTIISGSDYNDSIYSSGQYVTIYGGAGNDTIYNSAGDGLVIFGEDGDDTIRNSVGYYVTIDGGDGNDTITNSFGHASSVSGGAGDDVISLVGSTSTSYFSSYAPVTVTGGAGNDTICADSLDFIILQYNTGDGNDVVTGTFSGSDILSVDGGNGRYTKVDNGTDIIVSVGSGSILFSGMSGQNINIVGISTSSVSSQYIVYNGGNQTVGSYSESQQVNLAADFKGVEVDGNNFIVKSSSGHLELQNVRGKLIKYGLSDNTPLAYSYLGTSSRSSVGNYYNTIDMTSRDPLYSVIIGGENIGDSIIAGAGGSSLWGGEGGNDTLVGGSGYDEFIYKLGSGNDVIQNASDSDLVNLEGISLENIISANISDSEISAEFSDGGSLKIQGTAEVGIRIEGVTFAANRPNNSWYTK